MTKQLVDMMRRVRKRLRRSGASSHDAEDLVQEAFLRVEAFARDAEVRSQEAVLARAAANLAVDAARRRRRAPFEAAPVDLELIADAEPGPEEVLRARERLARLRAGLDQLSPKARRILLAQRIDGLSYREIAACEGVSVAAVEKQIARAMLFLKDWLAPW